MASPIPDAAYLTLVHSRYERRMDLSISEEALPGNHSVTPSGSELRTRVPKTAHQSFQTVSIAFNARLHFLDDRKHGQQHVSPSDDGIGRSSEIGREDTRIEVSTTTAFSTPSPFACRLS